MAKKEKQDEWQHIGDKVTTHKLIKSAKFNWKFVEIAARLKAADFSDKDLAFVFGVEPCTVDKWKERYPQFRKACQEGSEIAVSHLVAKGLKSAGGYDYEDVKQEFQFVEKEVDGKKVIVKEMVKEVRQQKHRDANPALLMFFLTNMAPQYFKDIRKVEIETNHNINIDVKESDAIKKLCGALSQVAVGAGVVDAEFEVDKTDEDDFEIS